MFEKRTLSLHIDGGLCRLTIFIALGICGLSTMLGASFMLFKRFRKKEEQKNQIEMEVQTRTLRGLKDVDIICEAVSEGNVIILSVRELAKIDMIRLKRTIQQLKSFTKTNGGDILALGKDFVVIIPPNMKFSLLGKILQEAETEEESMKPPAPPKEVGII